MLYFLDEASGSWLPMPLNWERHVPNITSIIDKVQVLNHNGYIQYYYYTPLIIIMIHSSF